MTLKEQILARAEEMRCPWDDRVSNDNCFLDWEEVKPLILALAEFADQIDDFACHNYPSSQLLNALDNLRKVMGE